MKFDLGNRPTFSVLELIKCTALIILGCAVFYAMPDDMGILGWILFAIGTFLNIVGIFRLVATVPDVQDDTDRKLAAMVALVAAVVIQFIGLAYLYNSGGTVKAMAITTLSLCMSLGLVIYVVDFDDEEMKIRIRLVCRILTVFLIAIAVFLNVRDDFARNSIYVGTILMIEAIITGRQALKR